MKNFLNYLNKTLESEGISDRERASNALNIETEKFKKIKLTKISFSNINNNNKMQSNLEMNVTVSCCVKRSISCSGRKYFVTFTLISVRGVYPACYVARYRCSHSQSAERLFQLARSSARRQLTAAALSVEMSRAESRAKRRDETRREEKWRAWRASERL